MGDLIGELLYALEQLAFRVREYQRKRSSIDFLVTPSNNDSRYRIFVNLDQLSPTSVRNIVEQLVEMTA